MEEFNRIINEQIASTSSFNEKNLIRNYYTSEEVETLCLSTLKLLIELNNKTNNSLTLFRDKPNSRTRTFYHELGSDLSDFRFLRHEFFTGVTASCLMDIGHTITTSSRYRGSTSQTLNNYFHKSFYNGDICPDLYTVKNGITYIVEVKAGKSDFYKPIWEKYLPFLKSLESERVAMLLVHFKENHPYNAPSLGFAFLSNPKTGEKTNVTNASHILSTDPIKTSIYNSSYILNYGQLLVSCTQQINKLATLPIQGEINQNYFYSAERKDQQGRTSLLKLPKSLRELLLTLDGNEKANEFFLVLPNKVKLGLWLSIFLNYSGPGNYMTIKNELIQILDYLLTKYENCKDFDKFLQFCHSYDIDLHSVLDRLSTMNANTFPSVYNEYRVILDKLYHDENVRFFLKTMEHEPSKTLGDTTIDTIEDAHKEIELNVTQEKFDITHTYNSSMTKHFLITPVSKSAQIQINRTQIPTNEALLNLINLKLKTDVKSTVIKVEDIFTLNSFKLLSESLKLVLPKLLKSLSLEKNSSLPVIKKQDLHDNLETLTLKEYVLVDPKTQQFGLNILHMLNSIVADPEFLNDYTTVNYINNTVYKEKQITVEDKIIDKQNVKERKQLYSDYKNPIFTGYNNTFLLNRLDKQKTNAVLNQAGRGKKAKGTVNLEHGYADLNDLLESGCDYKSAVRSCLKTAKRVLDPGCQSCSQHVSMFSKIVIDETILDETLLSSEIEETIDQFAQLSLPGVEDSIIKENLHKLKYSSLNQSLMSTQHLFENLLRLMNVSRIKQSVTVITSKELGRYFLVLPPIDNKSEYIEYVDIYINQNKKQFDLKLINFDTCAIQAEFDGYYIAITKPIKLNRTRIEVLSKVYMRYLLCASTFSMEATNIVANPIGKLNCLLMASNITMARLGIFDLARHQFNLVISTCANYKKFITDKYEWPCKSIGDYFFYKQIIDWLKGLCIAKTSFLAPDFSDSSRQTIQHNQDIFLSYVTQQGCTKYSQLLACVFGGIYFSPKALHEKATSLWKLQEVPADWELRLQSVLEKLNKGESWKWFATKLFDTDVQFGHNSLLLLDSSDKNLTETNLNIVRNDIIESSGWSKPIDATKTLVSTKSSVHAISRDKDTSFSLLLKESTRKILKCKHIPTIKDFVTSFRDHLNEIELQMIEEEVESLNISKKNKFSNCQDVFDSIEADRKIYDLPEVLLLKKLHKMESFIRTQTLPVQSALYNFLKENGRLVDECGNLSDLISELFSWLIDGKLGVPLFNMFPKGQRTKVDREIYIPELIEKYMMYFVEQIFQSLNKTDMQEAITISGDEKKAMLLKLETFIRTTANQWKDSGLDVETGYMSMDQSKWSAADSWPKYLILSLTLHFLSISDRIAIFLFFLRYMDKQIIVNDDVLTRLQTELEKAGHHESFIVKVTNNLKKNHFTCSYNWLQGNFNNTSSRVHSLAMNKLKEYWAWYLNKIDPNGNSEITFKTLVHSDDGVIGYVAKLSNNASKIIQDQGGLQKLVFSSVEYVLKNYGITLNVSKTFSSEAIVDFISDYIIEKEPVGNVARIMGVLLAPLDHKSPYLDMLQLSGLLQNLVKSAANAQQLKIATFVGSWFIQNTYNLTSKRNRQSLNQLKQDLEVDCLPLSLFGPISMPAELLGVYGLRPNDTIILLSKLAKDLSNSEDDSIEYKVKHFLNITSKPTERQCLEFLLSSNNLYLLENFDWVSDSTLCLSQMTANMAFPEESDTVFDALHSNLHLFKIPVRKKQQVNLRRAPHIKDMLQSFNTKEEYLSSLSNLVSSLYVDEIDYKSLVNFKQSMQLRALSSKSFSNLSRMSTVETRINIMTDINKKYFQVGDILHAIDSSVSSMSYVLPTDADHDTKLKDYYDRIASVAVTNKFKVFPPEDDIWVEANMNIVRDLSKQFGNNNLILNPVLQQFLNTHISEYGADYKFNLTEGLRILCKIVPHLKCNTPSEYKATLKRTLKHSFICNVGLLNSLSYSLLSEKIGSDPNKGYKIVKSRAGQPHLEIVGDINEVFLAALKNDDYSLELKDIQPNMEPVVITMKYKDVISRLNLEILDTYLRQNYKPAILQQQSYTKVLLFHYYADAVKNALSQILKPKQQGIHYYYIKDTSPNTDRIITALKGNLHKDFKLYGLSSNPSNSYSYYDILRKVSNTEVNWITNLESLYQFCDLLQATESISRTQSILLKTNMNNEHLRTMFKAIADNSFINGQSVSTLLARVKQDSLLPKTMDQLTVLVPLHNTGLYNLSDIEIGELTSKPYLQWPNSEEGPHLVTVLTHEMKVDFKFKSIGEFDEHSTIIHCINSMSNQSIQFNVNHFLQLIYKSKIKYHELDVLKARVDKHKVKINDFMVKNTHRNERDVVVVTSLKSISTSHIILRGLQVNNLKIVKYNTNTFINIKQLYSNDYKLDPEQYLYNNIRNLYTIDITTDNNILTSVQKVKQPKSYRRSVLDFKPARQLLVSNIYLYKLIHDSGTLPILTFLHQLKWKDITRYFSWIPRYDVLLNIQSHYNINAVVDSVYNIPNMMKVLTLPYTLIQSWLNIRKRKFNVSTVQFLQMSRTLHVNNILYLQLSEVYEDDIVNKTLEPLNLLSGGFVETIVPIQAKANILSFFSKLCEELSDT